jgi:hypothetical protein
MAHRSRRQFIRQAATAAVAFGAAPAIVGATDKSGTRPAILGSGDHTYEVVGGWGALPAGMKYGYTHGVVIASHHRVVIHNQSKDSVVIFDESGRFIKSWGPQYQKGAHGLQLRVENGVEVLYLADYERHVVGKHTLDGEEIWTIGYPKEPGIYQKAAAAKNEGQPPAAYYRPTNVAFGPNGDFYVADGYGESWIHQYNIKAEYIRSWGGLGKEPGKLNCPHGIWCDTRQKDNPRLVVADRSNARLQYFTLDGKTLDAVYDELRAPCHFDQKKSELLIPDLHGRVTIFDGHNKLITHLGDTPGVWERKDYPNIPDTEWVTGKFISPHAAVWNHRGDIYVVEWIAEGRVTKLRRV